MKIRVECPHCGAGFKVPSEAEGRSAPCSQCGHRFELRGRPASAAAEQAPTAAAAAPMPDAAPLVDPPAIITSDNSTADDSTRPSKPATAEATPAPSTAAPVQINFAPKPPTESTMPAPQTRPSAVAPRPAKRSSLPAPLIWSAVGGVVTLAAIAVLAVVLTRDKNPSSNPRPAAGGEACLVLVLGDAAAESVSVRIDDVERDLKVTAEQQLNLAPGAHSVLIRRRGYEPVSLQLQLAAGDEQRITPQWKPLSAAPVAAAAARWLQNLDVAKRQAAENNLDVLALFIGSDWSPASRQLVAEGLSSPLFQKALAGTFQLAVLDYPMSAAVAEQVEDAAHNQWMLEKYGVKADDFPAMLAMDARGLPYGMLGEVPGSAIGSAAAVARISSWRAERDRLLQAARGGPPQQHLQAARAALRWLHDHQVLEFYIEPVRQWYTLAKETDPDNKQGLYEVFFEAFWRCESFAASRDNPGRLKQLVQMLQQWHQAQRFQDSDRAARLHLTAAIVLLQTEQDPAACQQLVEAGKTYAPRDAGLSRALEQLGKLLSGTGELSSGTGFVVAPGLVLTNFHVVDGPGRIMVHTADESAAPVAGQVVARDPQRDMALLRVADSGPPLPLDNAPPRRGGRMAAFGYPLGDEFGSGLKLTTGVVSGLPNASTDDMLLLDMRINPGNSGGPLCSAAGNVAGMVTARTRSSEEEAIDAYGMAIPTTTLLEFIRLHVPEFQSPPASEAAASGWDEVDRMVNRSVLRIVRVR